MDEQEPWHLTIVLLEGLRLIRPEKAWRPIITVEVDKHHIHETTLGVDGQCVNQKEVCCFHDATHSSEIQLKVWHRSQSKKKKRRILVASACHSLGELVKRQELDSKIEVKLQCRTAERAGTSSRGRPQQGAILRLKIRSPSGIAERELERVRPPWHDSASSEGDTDDSASVHTDDPLLDLDPLPTTHAHDGLRRRKIKGYAIDSGDSAYSSEADELYAETHQDDLSNTCVDEEEDYSRTMGYRSDSGDVVSFASGSNGWLAFSDLPLPLYTEKIKVPPSLSRVERALASVTMYREMAAAEREEDFGPVARRLQAEWTFIGGLLLALAAVDTAVFSISPDSIFSVDSWAKSAIATSSIASGLGIACDAWFLLRYGWADLSTFISRSRDLYSSHFFFSLSSRVPTFCTFASAISLMAFLGIVAYDAWPSAVLLLSFLVGVIMSLQFLVYGIHWCARKVAAGGRVGGRGVVTVVQVMKRSMSGGSVVA